MYDVERRAQRFIAKHVDNGRVRVHHVRFESLLSFSGARQLFRQLELTWTDKSSAFVRESPLIDTFSKDVTRFNIDVSLEECEARLKAYQRRCDALGFRLPVVEDVMRPIQTPSSLVIFVILRDSCVHSLLSFIRLLHR